MVIGDYIGHFERESTALESETKGELRAEFRSLRVFGLLEDKLAGSVRDRLPQSVAFDAKDVDRLVLVHKSGAT